ncbi:hypothetical protein QFC24_003597 [Naganishia onofrii]|uniref:Uncharacterized protein n=1 Tax=Naganishia onofrii TaxID=1851511 RepID=A0ACC2XIF2_9TREE|nr:hypothetical protein QFC24_003597 [Naganishia onofrii]
MLSSRNSEVIHAGIYYPLNSLKSQYCVRGRELLYDRCQRLGIGHKKTGKLILATSTDQIQYLDELHASLQHPILESPTHSPMTGLGVPTYFLGPNEAADLEPDLGPNVLAAMLSTESGIVDSHALMESLEMEINGQLPDQITESDAGRGSVVLGTKVVRIDPYRDESGGKLSGPQTGWVVQTLTEGSTQPDSILAKTLVLSAGLSCVHLLNPLLPPNERLTAYYAKGSYLSYKGPGAIDTALECPSGFVTDTKSPAPQTQTIDLAGNIKFGPDVEYLFESGSPDHQAASHADNDASTRDPDWWQEHLKPSAQRKEEMCRAIQDYLPNIDPDHLTPDYAGIRPNLAPPGSPFTDFHISYNPAERPGLIALCGFNSPGLTSSLAVAQDVEEMIRQDYWGLP